MNHSKVQRFMLSQNADWIVWKRNPLLASHMAGVWGRQIRSARSILSSLLRSHSSSLYEESLNTLFAEVEAIINSNPLVVETINDTNSEVALSPSDLLTMKSKVVMSPPGVFGTPDLYCLGHLICTVKNVGGEYSTPATNFGVGGVNNSSQPYKKGKSSWFLKETLGVGDIVILKEVSIRNEWKIAKVVDVYNDEKGHAQSFQLYVGVLDPDQLLSRVLVCPTDKIVLLVEMNEVRSPTEEP